MKDGEFVERADARDEDRDGSHALTPNDGFEPLTVEVEGEYDHVHYLHRVTFFWNERNQFMIQVWNEAANVQGAGAKGLTIAEAKELRNYLSRTIPQIEGKH